MSGHPDPHELALWAGGDLHLSDAPRVGLHLDGCAECRQTVEEIESTQVLLRSAFAEPSEVDVESVRGGLARRLAARQRTARWCWSMGCAAAALLILFLGATYRKLPVPPVAERSIQLPRLSAPAHVELEIPEVKQVARPRPQRPHAREEAGLRAVNLLPGADGSLELRLTTADPNVIILLPPTERTVEQ